MTHTLLGYVLNEEFLKGTLLVHFYLIFSSFSEIFLFVKANLNIYADDQQIYDSHQDPAALHLTMQNELDNAVHWYKINGLKANP